MRTCPITGSAGGPGGSGASVEDFLAVPSLHATAAMTRRARRSSVEENMMSLEVWFKKFQECEDYRVSTFSLYVWSN